MATKRQWTDGELADMKYLRYVHGHTLQSIGDKYGITRERVRQLIGNTGRILLGYQRDVLSYKQAGLSVETIGELTQLNPKSVERILRKYKDEVFA